MIKVGEGTIPFVEFRSRAPPAPKHNSSTKVGKIKFPTFETKILSIMRIWGIRFFLWAIISFASGSVASLFLWGLQKIAESRQAYFLLGLPLVGLLLHGSKKWKITQAGTNDLIKQLNGETIQTSFLQAPLTILSTWLSHLAGASVGREGAAVFMGGSIASASAERFIISTDEKSIWLRAGMSAGFAAIFGTPLAGCFFGLEIKEVGKIHYRSILASLSTAFAANLVSLHVYGTKHVLYPHIFLPSISLAFWAKLVLIGLFLALIARIYSRLESIIYFVSDKLPAQAYQKAILAGLILLAIFQIPFFQQSIGLGSEYLLRPFDENFSAGFFAIQKLIATCFSVGLGFKGGEATPLFLIGSHAMASFADILELPGPFLAALGFTCLYMGMTKTPIASMCMGIELFGVDTWFCYLIVTIIVMYFAGKKGLFKSQTWAKFVPSLPY
jgi:H+/Cl- antiporter ClcA